MVDRPSSAASAGSPLGLVAPVVRGRGYQILGRRKWITFVSIFISIFAALFHSLIQKPAFTSSAQLMFEPSLGSNVTGPQSTTGFEIYLHAQAQLLMSAPVLDQAATLLHGAAESSAELPQKMHVDLHADSGILTVCATTPVASDSAAIVNAVVDAYQHYTSQQGPLANLETLRFLQTEKDQHDTQLTTLNRQLTNFKTLHPDVALTDSAGNNLILTKLAKLNDQLTDAQTTLLNLNAKYDASAALIPPDASPAPTTQSTGVATADDLDADQSWLQGELKRTAATLDALSSRSTASTDQNLIDTKAYEARLQQKLATCQRTISLTKLAAIKTQQNLAQIRQFDLQNAVDNQKALAANLNSQLAESARLEDQARRAQKSDDDVDSRLKAFSSAMDSLPKFRVVENARPAAKPDPISLQLLGLAVAAGLFTGIALSWGLDLLDTRLRSPDEVRNLLGLPILGIVPTMRGQPSVEKLGLISHSDAMSPIADGIRRVRSAIFAASRSTPVKTILITSPTDGEGKSIFAANLAIVMAQAGGRTLLIDANNKSPSVAKMFDLRVNAGLSDVIAGKLPAGAAINRTPIEGLEVLSCGTVLRNSADMLNGIAFTKLIKQLGEKYQCILLDAPSVLSSNDARILASQADLTLLIVRSGATVRKAADQALDQLLSVGSHVLGAVMNGYSTGKKSRQMSSALSAQVPHPMRVESSLPAVSTDRSIVAVGGSKIRSGLSAEATR